MLTCMTGLRVLPSKQATQCDPITRLQNALVMSFFKPELHTLCQVPPLGISQATNCLRQRLVPR